MKDKSKIIFIIGIILVLGVAVFILLNRNNLFKGNDIFDKKNKEPVVENVEISNNANELEVVSSRIEKLDEVSNIFIKVKNNTEDVIDKSDLRLVILNKNGNVLLMSDIVNVEKFEIGEEREFQITTGNDIKDADKYLVEKVLEE